MELHLVITISWSDLMQNHCIGYPHSHVTYTKALDHCVCIKYKVGRSHSVTYMNVLGHCVCIKYKVAVSIVH